MSAQKAAAPAEKIFSLRKGDPFHSWRSIDDRRCCILCERTFSGRQIEVSAGPGGQIRLHCPTERCTGTPNEWVHPGNPLISRKAWRDWERVLNGQSPDEKRRPSIRKTKKLPYAHTAR
jgi:hypothetical protein